MTGEYSLLVLTALLRDVDLKSLPTCLGLSR